MEKEVKRREELEEKEILVQDFLNEKPGSNIVIISEAINGFSIGIMNDEGGKSYKIFLNEKTGKNAFGNLRFEDAEPFSEKGIAQIKVKNGRRAFITNRGSITFIDKKREKKFSLKKIFQGS